MGKPGAFLDIDRVTHELRPVEERSRDFDPLYVELDDDARRAQASRCMMCGVAFCQMGASFGKARPSGCPLHNLIPEWNELVYRGRWDEAAERLSLTSPMPEFTSRVCPALCEAACNLGSVDGQPTTIHDNERAISDHEWANGGPRRFEPAGEDAPTVAVVGSGPAGLVAAWELARRGARVNHESVELKAPTADELAQIRALIQEHVDATQSPRGIKLLYSFDSMSKHFVKVIPTEYERVLAIVSAAEAAGKAHAQAEELAFDIVTGRAAAADVARFDAAGGTVTGAAGAAVSAAAVGSVASTKKEA